MIALAEAQALALALVDPLPAGTIALADAIGAVLAADVATEEPIPPFPNSAMDGYAVRAADTDPAPTRLRIAGEILAGTTGELPPVEPGTAVRIMTGAPFPPGADAVVMVERTVTDDDGATVVVATAVTPGEFVRPAGSDVPAGSVVARHGDVVTAARAGLIAAAGHAEVHVHPRPVVGVLSTGDELVDPPAALAPGQIYDANRVALLSSASSAGAAVVDLGIVGDRDDALDAALAAATARCDLVLTSGGVSMGDVDLVKARLTSYQVAIKPAKPLAIGHLDGTPVIGLPGNPVSALVSFELFARPVIRRLAGHEPAACLPEIVVAIAGEDLARPPDGKLHLVRVVTRHRADGRVEVRTAGEQGSHVLSAMAAADALALLPDGTGAKAGDDVDVMLLR